MAQKTASSADLTGCWTTWSAGCSRREHAVVLSTDGLLMASSGGLSRDDGEHLAAMAAGIQSLARGAGKRFGGGEVQQTIIEMQSSFLFVTAAGRDACLAVLAAEDADVGLIAYEMAMLVTRVGQFVASPTRAPEQPSGEHRRDDRARGRRRARLGGRPRGSGGAPVRGDPRPGPPDHRRRST